VETERRTPLSGTLDRSNSNRELVKRTLSSDGRQRIRKRAKQLARASKGRHGASAYRANPIEVWNKIVRWRKGFRCGGWLVEKIYSIRTISQYSQLHLQVEQSRKTKESQGRGVEHQ
jgi:hypothetical protein